MNLYLAILLIAILFGIIIKNILGKPKQTEGSKTKATIVLMLGIVGLLWSVLFNPVVSIFSFGIVPLVSLIFLISGIVRLVKLKKIQDVTIMK